MFDIDTGRAVLERLRSEGFGVSAAAWVYDDLSDYWQFLIASPEYDERGPLQAYGRIQAALAVDSPPVMPLQEITLVSPNSEVIRALDAAVVHSPGTTGRRLRTHLVAGSLIIQDAYVYNLQNRAPSVISR